MSDVAQFSEQNAKPELKMKLRKKQNIEIEWEVVYSPFYKGSISKELPEKKWETKLETKSVVNKIGESITASNFVNWDSKISNEMSIFIQRNGYIKLDTVNEYDD